MARRHPFVEWADQVFVQPVKALVKSSIPQTRAQHRDAMRGAFNILARAVGATSGKALLDTAVLATTEGKRKQQQRWAQAALAASWTEQLGGHSGEESGDPSQTSLLKAAHQATRNTIEQQLDAFGTAHKQHNARSLQDAVAQQPEAPHTEQRSLSGRDWIREARAEVAAAAAAITEDTLSRSRLAAAASAVASTTSILGVGADGEAQRLDTASRLARPESRSLQQTANSTSLLLSDLPCSGVGRQAVGNETFIECNGARVTPAVRVAIQALQAAVTADAGDAVILALEAALFAAPGFNISLLVPASTPIPAGVNFTALPIATQQALLAAANVSSFANLTTFGQIIGPDGTIADGALNATDLLPLVPVNTTVALVQDVECRDASETGLVCACPLDFRGAQCESRRALVLGMRVEDTRLRGCLEDPSRNALFPDTAPNEAGVETTVGFGGTDTLASGLPSCLFFTSGDSPAQANAARTVSIPIRLSMQFHADDRPSTWFCNASALTAERVDELLEREGRSRATATGPAPWFGLPCVEASMEYEIGPTLDAAVTGSPRVVLAARVWSFDALSDERFATGVEVVSGVSTILPAMFGGSPVSINLPQPAQGVTIERMPPSTAAEPALQAGESLWTVSIPASELPAHFVPAGRAHLEIAAAQVLLNGERDAFPSLSIVNAESQSTLPSVPCCGTAETVAQLSAWPPLPVRRPWPLLAVALDDANWTPPVPDPDAEAITTAVVLVVCGIVLVVGLAAWWMGRCGFMEEALGLEGRCARAYWLESQRLDRERVAARDADARMTEMGGSLEQSGGEGTVGEHPAAASSAFADDDAYHPLPAPGNTVTMLAAGGSAARGDIELSTLHADAKDVSGQH